MTQNNDKKIIDEMFEEKINEYEIAFSKIKESFVGKTNMEIADMFWDVQTNYLLNVFVLRDGTRKVSMKLSETPATFVEALLEFLRKETNER